jgi:hypothetical protein
MANQNQPEPKKVSGPRSVYLGPLYADIQKEAERTKRSVSFLIREAWMIALPEIKKIPTMKRREKNGSV